MKNRNVCRVECQECHKEFNEGETHPCPHRDCFAEYICKNCFEDHVEKCSKLFKNIYM